MPKYYKLNGEEITEDSSTCLHPNTAGNRAFTDYREHRSLYDIVDHNNKTRDELQNGNYANKEFKNVLDKFRKFVCDESQDRQCGTNIIRCYNDYKCKSNRCARGCKKIKNNSECDVCDDNSEDFLPYLGTPRAKKVRRSARGRGYNSIQPPRARAKILRGLARGGGARSEPRVEIDRREFKRRFPKTRGRSRGRAKIQEWGKSGGESY